jgi:hypothetical protein
VGAGLLRFARAGLTRLLAAPAPAAAGDDEGPAEPGGLSDCRVFPSMLPRRAAAPPAGAGASPRPRPARAPAPPTAPHGPALVWFRSDLRLADHAPLCAASEAAAGVVPVYCFDPREYGAAQAAGLDRTGPFRAAFVVAALRDLRRGLRARGGDLVVRVGRPEEVLPQLAAAVGATHVYCHGEATVGERRLEAAVAAALRRQAATLRVLWGGTLLHPDDLPFGLDAVPLSYREFRDRVGAGGQQQQAELGQQQQPKAGRGARAAPAPAAVRRPLEAPETVKGPPAGAAPAPGPIPTLLELGFDAPSLRRAEAHSNALWGRVCGGEREALEHMRVSERVSPQLWMRLSAVQSSCCWFATGAAPGLDGEP